MTNKGKLAQVPNAGGSEVTDTNPWENRLSGPLGSRGETGGT